MIKYDVTECLTKRLYPLHIKIESGAYYKIQTFQMLNTCSILQAINGRLLTVLDC